MNTKIKSALSSLGAIGAVVAYLALIAGILAVFFYLLDYLAAAANFIAAISLIVLAPLLAISIVVKRARNHCARGMLLISYLIGISTWLTATVWLYELWGPAAVVIGVLFFGIGSVPLGCLALLFHGKFSMMFILLGQLALVYGLRLLSFWIDSKSSSNDFADSPFDAAREAQRWLDYGRQFYDLADQEHWDPEAALKCFERGLEVMPENTDLHVYAGMLYVDGDGTEQDFARAFEHFSTAAQLGDSNGQRSLAEMYENGEGVPQDLEKAAFWYRKAADGGDSHSKLKTEVPITRDKSN